MGLYDTILFNCPNCGAEYGAQSKSGECILGSYERHAVPVEVCYDANRHSPFECDCGKSYEFVFTPPPAQPDISLALKDLSTGDIIE